jgi:cytochrome d ubiquinol oxidase subunit II
LAGILGFRFRGIQFPAGVLFGAAAGNLARGVPLDAQGNFSMAFFTNFQPHGYVGLLDWFTISVAIFAVVILAAHGATYLTLKTEGTVHDRSASYAKWLWAAFGPLMIIISLQTWLVRPELPLHGIQNAGSWLGILVVFVAGCAVVSGLRNRNEMRAFIGSNFVIVGLLATGATALFPVMLFSTLVPENSLTADAVASSPHGLFLAAIWWPVAFILAATYFIFISRHYKGKVSVRRDNQGYY